MTFTDKTLVYSYFYPHPNTPIEGDDFGVGEIKVTEETEVTAKFYSIDIGSTYVRFEFSDTGVFKVVGTFNGAVFEDADGQINAMSRFRLQTNMSGLDEHDFTLKPDKMMINFAGTAFTEKTYIHIQVIFAPTIVLGTAASETLIGSSGADKLRGLAGDDILRGDAPTSDAARSGNASVTGDADWLIGGSGVDRFVFAVGDTSHQWKRADVIKDFDPSGGEIIDLGEWDADEGQIGHQTFTFIGKQEFSDHARELHYMIANRTTYVEGDTDGDGQADFAIRLQRAGSLNVENFQLL